MIARALLICLFATLSGCASLRSALRLSSPASESARADALVQGAAALLAQGQSARALSDLREARDADSLSTEQKNRIELLMERCAEARIAELSMPGSDPDDMEELFDLNLPRQIAITAGVRCARLLLDQDEPVDAYQMIQKVDTRYPPAGTHHERVAAGDILFEAGMQLADSGFSFLGMFSDVDDARAILEYMVQNYPQERRCDQAYHRLAGLYEDDRLWTIALERYQDLVTYHLDSPLAAESEWRIPHLRLAALRRPEYDRRELTRALAELDAWMQAHAGSEFEASVLVDRKDCLERLAQSDLGVAHFYSVTEKWEGARIHAERALEFARRSGDAPTVEKAERSLALIPPGAGLPSPAGSTPAPAATTAPATGNLP